MKKFSSLILIAGALMVSVPSQARMVSSRYQCVTACDGNGATDYYCDWITKRAKWTRCRAKLLQKCRSFGADVMCPAPEVTAPPTTIPAPVVTTTTQPAQVVVTTTTVPYVPPTTTTLPVVTYPELRYGYEFIGTAVSDPCGLVGYGTGYDILFAVTAQSGTSLAGTIGSSEYEPAQGELYSDYTWALSTGLYYKKGCYHDIAIGVGDVAFPADGYLTYTEVCPTITCKVEFAGTVY